MPSKKFYTTFEACAVLQTYGTRLWSFIGRGLSAPLRVGARLVYWHAEEVDRLAAAEAKARNSIRETEAAPSR